MTLNKTAIQQGLRDVYTWITEDEDASVCEDIPDSACREAPRNFFLNAANGALTKLGDQLANPGLVLTWFLDALGASAGLVGLLIPVRRAGTLLPQLFISGRIRQFEKRKWFWFLGGAGFGIAVVLMVPSSLLLPGAAASILILVLLGIGSMFRGISSVAFKDVLAKTIPRGKRGTLLAARATIGGILALVAGLLLRTQVQDQQALLPYVLLVGLAGLLWLAGVALVLLINEEPGATGGSRNTIEEARAGFHLLSENAPFRQFVLTRGVLVSIELSLSFYTLFARRTNNGGAGALGVFVIAASLAQVLSSPVWGRLADRTSRLVLVAASAAAVLAGMLALSFSWLPGLETNVYLLVIPVLLIGFAIAGVRLGRNTYLVDVAPAVDRPLYAALTNTLAGVIILLGGGLGFIAEAFSLEVLLAVLTVLALVGVWMSWRLTPTDQYRA
ncbi:MAG: MFS transporter [Anaerolineales bacterium]